MATHILDLHPTIQRGLDIQARRAAQAEYRATLATVESTTVRPDGITVIRYADAGRPPLLPHQQRKHVRSKGPFRSSDTPKRVERITAADMIATPAEIPTVRTYSLDDIARAEMLLHAQRVAAVTPDVDRRAQQAQREQQALAWLNR